MKNTEFVYLNDRLVDADKAMISIHDTGVLHGIGLFETMRSYNGKVFALEDHLDRLYNSAQALEMNITQTRASVTTAVNELLQANHLTDQARLRLTVTPGSVRNVTEDNLPINTMFITATKFVSYPEELYATGMMTIITKYKQNPDEPGAGHKTLNYFPRLAALQQAQQNRAGEALWFTTTNRLAEGCISNVFIVLDGELLTPPVDTPVLPGIVRKIVIEAAGENNISVRERPIIIKELLGASEVFLTNSIMELMPVAKIENHQVHNGEPGPIYKKLHDLYREITLKGS